MKCAREERKLRATLLSTSTACTSRMSNFQRGGDSTPSFRLLWRKGRIEGGNLQETP